MRLFTCDRRGRERRASVEIIGCQPRPPLALARRLPAAGHLAAPAAFLAAVRREHRRKPFDVIEGTNWYAPGALVSRIGPAPYVTRNSTPMSTSCEQDRSLRNRLDQAAARQLERAAAKASALLISNTNAHVRKIAGLYGVPGPGPAHAVIGLSQPPALRRAAGAAPYPAADEPPRLLFIGRNERRKGADLLLAALSELDRRRAFGGLGPFHATIVGMTEDDLAPLSPAARARTQVHHRLEDEEVLAALAKAHIVAAPSRYESFGLVYQEALAFGRPVAACAADPSAREFIGRSGAGLLSADHPIAYAEILSRLISSPDLRADCRQRALAASGQFTRERLARETVAVYRAAIQAVNGLSSAASSSGRAPSESIAA